MEPIRDATHAENLAAPVFPISGFFISPGRGPVVNESGATDVEKPPALICPNDGLFSNPA
ncbi:MAG: hypothetical protein R6U98_24870 [Pirellulaceae bacterium]